ncbi:reverse transcriptase domain-containing protein [Citrus sinensis]|uniref:Reverse transcriptase domain-containing protein n=1 Tax=Citrus sinensis TaxID=2711 RepID=A0ACB8I7U1_CITSI|nr:reverse transcriptase domain-containing protein [Citrus sinensis]
MNPDKSPGPDGMSPAFYQKFWHIVGKDVVAACLSFINDVSFPMGLNDTSIVLIPKKQRPETLADMRPIALCNVLYKIVSKLLANRMKSVLDSVVSEAQSAFVPGCAITDNIIVSAEIMHFLKRKRQGKHGVAALKIDMSKAYDRLEWGYLQEMMLKMGFDARWVNLIMLCVTTVRYKVLRENKEVGPIIPSRGLRQGDPLSPYLFILCAEGLSSLIKSQERVGLIHGVRVARSAPVVTHLFFADDSFLFFRANQAEALVVKQILETYGCASGQLINFSNSSISFSANVQERAVSQICGTLDVNATEDHGTYLGLPSNIGRKKKAVFSYIRDKVRKRLQGWQSKLLSRARKEILLKTVAQAMPNYAMNVYLLPLDLCKELEIMMNSFWWGTKNRGGRGISWMRWEHLCKPKDFGGMGFKQLHTFNIAMLGKQVWKLLTRPESLVAKTLKARYFPRTSVNEAKLGHNPSFVWRSIVAAKDVVVSGSRIQIGHGQQVLIGQDPWLPDTNNGFITSRIHEELAVAKVSSLMVPNQRSWDLDLLADIFNERDRELILQIPLSQRRESDVWYWLHDLCGVYSVRSCYKLLTHRDSDSSTRVWRSLWRLEVPSKVRNFLWRAATNVLPTTSNLVHRRVAIAPTCSLCNACNETVTHALLECGFARSCWISSAVGALGHYTSFLGWLEFIFTMYNKENCQLAAMICWRIWIHRNDFVWNQRRSSGLQVLNSAGRMLFQWQSAKNQLLWADVAAVNGNHGAVCWEKPCDGWLKCNVDAAIFKAHGKFSIGCVIRNSYGDFVTARCKCFPGNFGSREAEALGIREALSWIKRLQLTSVIIEMDNLQVFQALTEKFSSPNGFGLIIEECRSLAMSIGEVQFSFVRRSANSAAHCVARVGGSMSGPGEWRHVPPPCLLHNL